MHSPITRYFQIKQFWNLYASIIYLRVYNMQVVRTIVVSLFPGFGGGGTPENFGYGCAAKVVEPLKGKGSEKWHPIQGTQTTANVHR